MIRSDKVLLSNKEISRDPWSPKELDMSTPSKGHHNFSSEPKLNMKQDQLD